MARLDDQAARVRVMSRGDPDKAAMIETKSRLWMLVCPHCGHERSVWDTGGIRYNARGNPRWYMSCTQCGKAGWNRVVWRGPVAAGESDPNGSPGSVLRLVLAIVAGVGLLVTIILLTVFKLTGIL